MLSAEYIGRPQDWQIFEGRSDFLSVRGMMSSVVEGGPVC